MDSSDSGHSGTAVIMLVSVVLMGLAIFVIYKFKRYSILDTVNKLYSALEGRFTFYKMTNFPTEVKKRKKLVCD